MRRLSHHVFVCNNARPEGGRPACAARGGLDVLAALQEHLGARPDLWGKVAVTPSGCLGPCFEGPVLVVYPAGTFYAPVNAGDVPDIVASHLVRGEPLARLALGSEDAG